LLCFRTEISGIALNKHRFLPYIKILDKYHQRTLNILIDSGANKNLLRPGILKGSKECHHTSVKNMYGNFTVSSKCETFFLGPKLPPIELYEKKFHDFFDGLIGTETLSTLESILNYKNETITLLNQTTEFYKHPIEP